MTLIVTHVSDQGIAMLADSQFSEVDNKGHVVADSTSAFGQKLFKIPQLRGGLSFWGTFGNFTNQPSQWFRGFIANSKDVDLESFAQSLASELNRVWNWSGEFNHPFGVHIAGFCGEDVNGQPVPRFWHVHNGDLHSEVETNCRLPVVVLSDGTGLASDHLPGDHVLLSKISWILNEWPKVTVTAKVNERIDFCAAVDFPRMLTNDKAYASRLEHGHLTHNGDYVRFSLVARKALLEKALFRFPQLQNTQNGLERWILALDALVNESLHYPVTGRGEETIGGPVSRLAINPSKEFCFEKAVDG